MLKKKLVSNCQAASYDNTESGYHNITIFITFITYSDKILYIYPMSVVPVFWLHQDQRVYTGRFQQCLELKRKEKLKLTKTTMFGTEKNRRDLTQKSSLLRDK